MRANTPVVPAANRPNPNLLAILTVPPRYAGSDGSMSADL